MSGVHGSVCERGRYETSNSVTGITSDLAHGNLMVCASLDNIYSLSARARIQHSWTRIINCIRVIQCDTRIQFPAVMFRLVAILAIWRWARICIRQFLLNAHKFFVWFYARCRCLLSWFDFVMDIAAIVPPIPLRNDHYRVSVSGGRRNGIRTTASSS